MLTRRRLLITLGVVASPALASAQPPKAPWRIGSLHPSSSALAAPLIEALELGLAQRGYVKDKTTTIEYLFVAPSVNDLTRAAAAISQRSDVLLVWGTVAAVAAKRAAVSCPVVFVSVGFPEAVGLVKTLRQPGGNFTGISFEAADETYAKRLEIAKELVPGLTRVAALAAADDPNIGPALTTLHKVGPLLGVDVVEAKIGTPAELDATFAGLATKRVQAVGLREGVAAGGIVSLGPDLVAMARQAAGYVDKILRGERPGDLPVEQPVRYEVRVNLKTAKALGLTIPASLLARADQVIE